MKLNEEDSKWKKFNKLIQTIRDLLEVQTLLHKQLINYSLVLWINNNNNNKIKIKTITILWWEDQEQVEALWVKSQRVTRTLLVRINNTWIDQKHLVKLIIVVTARQLQPQQIIEVMVVLIAGILKV